MIGESLDLPSEKDLSVSLPQVRRLDSGEEDGKVSSTSVLVKSRILAGEQGTAFVDIPNL
jgi:hypothetical protein